MAHITIDHQYLKYGQEHCIAKTPDGEFGVYVNRRTAMYLLPLIGKTGTLVGDTKHKLEWDVPREVADVCTAINFMRHNEMKRVVVAILTNAPSPRLTDHLKARNAFNAALDRSVKMTSLGCSIAVASKMPQAAERNGARTWKYSLHKGELDITFEVSERPNEQLRFAAFVASPASTLAKWIEDAGNHSAYSNEWQKLVIRTGNRSFGGVTAGANVRLTRHMAAIIGKSEKTGKSVTATYLVES